MNLLKGGPNFYQKKCFKTKVLCIFFLNALCSWGYNGPLARYVKLRVAHAPGMPGTFSPPPRVIDPDMHHGTCVTHVSWCMPGSITSGFFWFRWRGTRSRHSRRMRNPQFYVSGKRPIGQGGLADKTMRHLMIFVCIVLWFKITRRKSCQCIHTRIFQSFVLLMAQLITNWLPH